MLIDLTTSDDEDLVGGSGSARASAKEWAVSTSGWCQLRLRDDDGAAAGGGRPIESKVCDP